MTSPYPVSPAPTFTADQLRAMADWVDVGFTPVDYNGEIPTSIGPMLRYGAAAEDARRRAEHIAGIECRQLERLALCPDHRDKASGQCIVCQAETRTAESLRAQLQTITEAAQALLLVISSGSDGCGFYNGSPALLLTACNDLRDALPAHGEKGQTR